MHKPLLLASLTLSLTLCAAPDLDWRKVGYEPFTPTFTNAAQSATITTAGLHGRTLPLVRVTDQNALGDESAKTWCATAWRHERVHGQFVVWSKDAAQQLRFNCSPLKNASSKTLPASAVKTTFVRYVWADGRAVGDVLDTRDRLDLPPNGYRPIWLTVTVPPKTSPGIYKGTLEVCAQGLEPLKFPLELEVLAARLPKPRDWGFFLDLWQHPWAIARYHDVAPFSPAHYAFMEPIYRELANAGQKTLTISIGEQPWHHQNFDPYHSMIKHTLNGDGTWSYDYTLFDQYVAFGKRCGLGPMIHCYTMVPWGNRVTHIDGVSGDFVAVERKAGTPEHEAFWGPFLQDFQKHLQKKGWAKETYIALDERTPEELSAAVACLKKHAPLINIAMAGNKPPSSFKGVEMAIYSQSIGHVNDPFLAEVPPRRQEGHTTTFYICCGPRRPNTFAFSPCAEQQWLGYYAAATGLDGMLRWAFTNWPRDPLWDTSFRAPGWPAGDTFLIYPGPRSSVRWEMLRDGIEEFEKLQILKKRELVDENLQAILSEFTFPRAAKQSDDQLAELVDRARRAISQASRKLR